MLISIWIHFAIQNIQLSCTNINGDYQRSNWRATRSDLSMLESGDPFIPCQGMWRSRLIKHNSHMFTFFLKQSDFHSQKSIDRLFHNFLRTHGSQNLVFVIKLQQTAAALPLIMALREDTSSVQLLRPACILQMLENPLTITYFYRVRKTDE